MTDYCPHGVRRGVLCPDCWDAMETEAAAAAGVAAGLRVDVAYLRERLRLAEGLAGALGECAQGPDAEGKPCWCCIPSMIPYRGHDGGCEAAREALRAWLVAGAR